MLISISPGISLIPMESSLLQERYGEKPVNRSFRRAAAIAGVTILTAIAAWFGFANYSPVNYEDLGYRVVSDYRTEVDFELSKPTQATVVCSIEALNNQFAQVGFVEVEFGPAEFVTQRHTIALNTTEAAVTGLVDECRLR